MSSEDRIPGLHHVTSIAKDPNENVSFYTDVLGLRLVKRTINFDEPSTYHLYYGDEEGRPGTAFTFFANGRGRDGTVGRGQPSATANRSNSSPANPTSNPGAAARSPRNTASVGSTA